MNTTSSSSTDDDELLLLIVCSLAFLTLLGSAAVYWIQGVEWLVEHGVLVAASAHPAVALPGLAGAGLDGPRLAIALGVAVVAIAWAGSAVRRVLRTRGRGQ